MDILVMLRLSSEPNEDELNPLVVANAIKKKIGQINIDCVTMDRRDVIKRFDRCSDFSIRDIYVLNDEQFAGADTFLTAHIISKFIKGRKYDIILGNHKSRFGETAHVPVSVAAMLELPFASNVYDLKAGKSFVCIQRLDSFNETVELIPPCVITCAGSLSDELEYNGMPNMYQMEVREPNINLLTAEDIQFEKNGRINIFSLVVKAEEIDLKIKTRKEITDVDSARKVLLKMLELTN